MGMALNDITVVDAPAFTGNADVTSHPPAQYNIDNASVREIHHSGVDKSARIACPRLATSQGIATATIDRAIVTAEDKRAAGSKDVLKSQPVIIADLQHPTIEPILKVEVVPEGYLHPAKIAERYHDWRKKLLVADCGRLIYERSIGWRVRGWRGHSGVRRHPCRA